MLKEIAMKKLSVHLVSHIGAHFEELEAMWFTICSHFSERAEAMIPGVAKADMLFWDHLPEGKTREQLESEGYVFFGRWGGEFDEHSTLTCSRKKDESAASLVAKKLGIEMDPTIKLLLQYTTSRDLRLGEGPFEFPAIVKKMHYIGRSPAETWKWSATVLEAIFSVGPEYFGRVKPEAGRLWKKLVLKWSRARGLDIYKDPSLAQLVDFTDKRENVSAGTVFEPHVLVLAMEKGGFALEDITWWAFKALDVIHEQGIDFLAAEKDCSAARKYPVTINGKEIVVVVGESNSLNFTRYARSSSGYRAGVVVVRNSAGNVMIETNSHLGLDLLDTVEILRREELRAKKMIIPSDRNLLRGENGFVGCEEWYCPIKEDGKGERILNGSTTKRRHPTNLPLESITGILFRGLKVEGFGKSLTSVSHRQ